MLNDQNGSMPQAGQTGRTLVLLREGASEKGPGTLAQVAGISAVRAAELGDEPAVVEAVDAEGVIYDELNVAVVEAAPDQVRALGIAVTGDSAILAVEPERLVHALETTIPRPAAPPGGALSAEYLRGFRDATLALSGMPAAAPPAGDGEMAAAPVAAVDETRATWGLQAIGALTSPYSGRGIKVAVLDTGMNVNHPDFAGRNPVTQSFIPGEAVEDGHGHGTHCIGTACGPRTPGQPPRYGVAYDAHIHAGKVLSDQGSGSDQGILAGIEWAIRHGCRVISMSLGAQIPFGTPYSRVFAAVGLRALARGALIVAAAGNNRGSGPVNHPANCPSILAVGALDSAMRVAAFSCRGDAPGGKVDLAAPGVAVHSTWPMPRRYHKISGTSMATPHVAGVAALTAEAGGVRGLELWGLLTENARPLELPCIDVGAGLVQAP